MRSPPNGEDYQALRKSRLPRARKMRGLPNGGGEDHQALRKAKRGNRRMQRKHQLKAEITLMLKKSKALTWR